MDFADVINALVAYLNGWTWGINGLVASPDLTEFQRQDTDMNILPIEFVKQSGDGDFIGFHGEMYFPTEYPDGDGGFLHLHIYFSE